MIGLLPGFGRTVSCTFAGLSDFPFLSVILHPSAAVEVVAEGEVRSRDTPTAVVVADSGAGPLGSA